MDEFLSAFEPGDAHRSPGVDEWWRHFQNCWTWAYSHIYETTGQKPSMIMVSPQEFNAACEMMNSMSQYAAAGQPLGRAGQTIDRRTGRQIVTFKGVEMRVSAGGSLVGRVQMAQAELATGFSRAKFQSSTVALRLLAKSG